MNRPAPTLLALTLLALLGCTTTEPRPDPAPAADLPSDPAKVAKLGEPCPTQAVPARGDIHYFCDAQGIAGTVLPVDAFPGVPPPAASVVRQEPNGILTVALEGERLWIRRVTCAKCRRVLGWSFGGDLPRLSDEALGLLQTKLGLPADPLLRTSTAWREAAPRIAVPAAP